MKVLRDAVHDLISLGPQDSFILELIDTKEFQRLRRIKQLGLANFVYPCAEHSRFVHSLGVFNFARRIVDLLLKKHEKKGQIVTALRKHADTIKVAALLHDLGHGPFSHVFERIFNDDDSIKHEEWMCKIILDRTTEVHKKLRKAKINVNDVCALVWDEAPQTYPGVSQVAQPFIKDIVSSQLDADRMDYLLRDSILTGARYGQYDCEWIMNALAIGEEPCGTRKMKLCLDASKGTGAINGFLVSRFLMTQHVYGHKTTRAYESELLCTLRLAAWLADSLPGDTPTPVLEYLRSSGKVPVKSYLLLDDEVTWSALRHWATWKKRLPRGNRKKEQAEALRQHALRLVRRHQPWAAQSINEADFVRVNGFISGLAKKQNRLYYECYADDGKFLPYKDLRLALGSAGDAEQAFFEEIFLLEKDERTRRLGDIRDEALVDALKKQASQCRFFYNRDFAGEFARLLKAEGVSLG